MKMTLLQDFDSDPDQLERHGFVRRNEPTTDSVRWVWFERMLGSRKSQLHFMRRIEFELEISDSLGTKYRDNLSYSFNRVVLAVLKLSDDADGKEQIVMGEYEVNLRTLHEVKQLANLLETHT